MTKRVHFAGAEETVEALDHDLNCDSITPSVKLLVTPSMENASYYDGDVYVALKCAILQPSTALRHAAETVAAIKLAGREGIKVLVIKTDGGPDRNNTFLSVQLAFLALALQLNLDALILMRTTPGQSYVNPVERIMSVINLVLYAMALARGDCGAETEAILKNCGTIKARHTAMKDEKSDGPSVHETRFAKSMQVWCTSLRLTWCTDQHGCCIVRNGHVELLLAYRNQ